MKPVISDNPSILPPNDIRLTSHHAEMLKMVLPSEWQLLFFNFRLQLQSRIAGADTSTLLKLQGNMEYLNELEKFFKEIK